MSNTRPLGLRFLFLAVLLIPTTAQAELIHFTTVHFQSLSGAGPSNDISMAREDDTAKQYVLFSDFTPDDVGQTLIATRETIGTEGWQKINGILSNGILHPPVTLLLLMNNAGGTLGKDCLFLGASCSSNPNYTYESPWVPPNGVDLGDYHIDEFRLTLHALQPFSWSLAMYGSPGHVPESSSAVLAAIAVFYILISHHHTPAFRRQWFRTASKSA